MEGRWQSVDPKVATWGGVFDPRHPVCGLTPCAGGHHGGHQLGEPHGGVLVQEGLNGEDYDSYVMGLNT